MKNIIKYIAALLLTIQLASCQNKEKMKTKFEWIEAMSCPLGYPAEVYSGGLISQDGNYTSIYLGVGTGNWGEGGGGMRGSTKQLPERLQAVWVSYAEDCMYEIDTEIDYDKMLKLFNEGYYVSSMSRDNPEPRKENYREIIVGLAPGGVVVIWISGAGRQIEIGRYQGKKTVIPQEEIARLDDHNKLLFDKKRRQEIMKNPAVIPPEIQTENEGKSIPFGLWDLYSKRYNWQLEIELPDSAKLKNTRIFFYNGEMYHLFGNDLIEKYPSIIPDILKWDTTVNKAIPNVISFTWLLDTRFSGKIKFNELEIFQAFQEIFEDNPNTDAKLIIHVNESKNYANVKLTGGGKEVWIMNSEVTVRKTDLTY